jgi:hypothetical protein
MDFVSSSPLFFKIFMVVVPFLRNDQSAVVFSAIYIFRQKIPGEIFGAQLGFSLQVIHSEKSQGSRSCTSVAYDVV